jgi:broad specificity phosphatase PhoE
VAFGMVFLARHGQTQWNTQGRKQGQLDSPLTAAGRDHAAALARFAATLEIDFLASSPLDRARTTAQIGGDLLGMKVDVFDELAEIHHGLMAGLTWAEAEARFPGQLGQRHDNKYEWRFPGGESYADADRRAALALELISNTGARRPLIVTHEMIGRMLLRNLTCWPPSRALVTQQPHDLVYQVNPATRQVRDLSTTHE